MPRVAAQAEAFLGPSMLRWEDLDVPLLDRRINPYTPLFTRIDPKRIESMTEASQDSMMTPATPPASPAKPAGTAIGNAPTSATTVGMDDFAKLDLRVAKVLACDPVEGSDKLLRFELDAGELGKRQVFSGIRASYGAPESLVGRNVVFIANLAPRKMRFGISEGMILSAGFDGGGLHPLDADTGALPGMPVR